MLKDTELKVYQKIKIEVDGEGETYQGEYLSRVAEIGDEYIKVSTPFNNGQIVPLRINLPVRISFTGERAAYFFDTQIIGRENEPLPVLIVQPPGELKRIQRRQYFRLEAKRDVKYRLLVSEEDEKEPGKYLKTTTIDISGGGLEMAVEEDLEDGIMLELLLDLPGLENNPLTGKVVQHYDLPDGKAVGIFFVEIDDNDRDKVIQWLFKHQRTLRQRGML